MTDTTELYVVYLEENQQKSTKINKIKDKYQLIVILSDEFIFPCRNQAFSELIEQNL